MTKKHGANQADTGVFGMQTITELNSLIEDPETDSELRSLALEDLEQTRTQLPIVSDKLKSALIPRHPFATLPCLLEIRPGAGGDEAGLFAYELLRMYQTFCSRKGLRTSIVKQDMEEATSNDRLTEAVVEIETPGSYDILRTEIGVHRVQRVPATEAKGRTHTSAVSVMILPSFPESGTNEDNLNFEDPNSDYYVNPQEVKSEKCAPAALAVNTSIRPSRRSDSHISPLVLRYPCKIPALNTPIAKRPGNYYAPNSPRGAAKRARKKWSNCVEAPWAASPRWVEAIKCARIISVRVGVRITAVGLRCTIWIVCWMGDMAWRLLWIVCGHGLLIGMCR